MMRIPLIIDTDPGIDDAIAILMALGSDKLDVRAITPVAGNKTIDVVCENALKIVELSGKEVKVARGASGPINRVLETADWVHGESGMGTLELPKPKKELYHKPAIDTIYEEAVKAEGRLQILAIGPLTNVALAIRKYPDLVDLIEKITIMGGAVNGGNTTPASEFNIFVDPEAARIVFKSGIPVIMVGLDVTHQALIFEDEIHEIKAFGSKVAEAVSLLMLNTLFFCKQFGFDGGIMHDPYAAAVVINNEIINTKKYHVDVETQGEITRGKTVVDVFKVTGKKENIDVGLGIDREGFVEIVKETIGSYS